MASSGSCDLTLRKSVIPQQHKLVCASDRALTHTHPHMLVQTTTKYTCEIFCQVRMIHQAVAGKLHTLQPHRDMYVIKPENIWQCHRMHARTESLTTRTESTWSPHECLSAQTESYLPRKHCQSGRFWVASSESFTPKSLASSLTTANRSSPSLLYTNKQTNKPCFNKNFYTQNHWTQMLAECCKMYVISIEKSFSFFCHFTIF